MRKKDYDKYYNKKFVGLKEEDEKQLEQIINKIKFSDEDIKILNAFYMPNDVENFETPEMITPMQMKAELRNIFVLLKHNYAGWEWFNKNNNLEKIEEELKEIVNSNSNPIKTVDFFKLIMDYLHKEIKDNHFSLIINDKIFRLDYMIAPYFTDIIVKENNGKYIVFNDNKYFPRNYLIKDDITNYLFKTLPDNNNEIYLLGILQDMNSINNSIVIDEKNIPLHLSKSLKIKTKHKNEISKYEDFNYLNLYKCYVDDELNFKKYFEIEEELKEKNKAVISVVNNPGGSSIVCSQIISGLNNNGNWNVNCSTLNIYQESGIPIKYYTYYSSESADNCANEYEKELYILMNKYTASAGESLVAMSNNIKKVIKVGTNTMGCGYFGETKCYVLPQTHATIILPYKAFYMDGFEEGIGYLPDYWMDDENMIETFKEWLTKIDKRD